MATSELCVVFLQYNWSVAKEEEKNTCIFNQLCLEYSGTGGSGIVHWSLVGSFFSDSNTLITSKKVNLLL